MTKQRINLSYPLWVLGQEQLERMQLLRDTFDVVKAVDSDDDLAAAEALLKLLQPLLDIGLVDTL